MTDKIKAFHNEINGKRITVIGIGISNRPLIRYLVKYGAKVTACDKKNKEQLGEVYDEFTALGVNLVLGENYMDSLDADIIFKTPGMRFDHPALLTAKENGAKITSEMEVFFDICPCKMIAVTGSDGKTTTTTLIYKMLSAEGYTCHLGGNIGTPLLTKAEEMNADDFAVLELSSFQLHTMRKSPDVAVITNISPNHLDMHKDYQEYIDAKKNIMLYQDSEQLIVLNKDNDVTCSLADEAKGKRLTFSRKSKADIYLDENYIVMNKNKVLDIRDIKIPGMHNVENYMAAIAATNKWVSPETVQKVAREFGGVEHRIELVRTLDGVRYYNSSIDSSPNRTINTLRVFSEPVVLICGGKDKGIAYDDIGPAILEKVKALILIGATSDVIQEAVEKAAKDAGITLSLPIYRETEYVNAVNRAKDCAKEGDVVLLSNASTSFDMFQNFEQRGNLFKELVLKL
ncbi:MAG: UDP-N-acetylmuramoyl-L-alanine--D-glutamate ligase [Clostridia bacterium]|nr:UDP-N-acetylmuramoyl-L-alanine--D-glutamate ligase [Clostridia bacterium]